MSYAHFHSVDCFPMADSLTLRRSAIRHTSSSLPKISTVLFGFCLSFGPSLRTCLTRLQRRANPKPVSSRLAERKSFSNHGVSSRWHHLRRREPERHDLQLEDQHRNPTSQHSERCTYHVRSGHLTLLGLMLNVHVRSPFSAGATLLPLTPENGYTPEILICGGSQLSDSDGGSVIDSQSPTSDQCSRLVLDAAGIAEGWKVETMPQARTMLELILLPDGRVVIVNGAQTGVAGYGFVRLSRRSVLIFCS